MTHWRSSAIPLIAVGRLSGAHMLLSAGRAPNINTPSSSFTERFGLIARPCPLPMPTFRFMMIFGELLREHEGHAWFRDFVAERWRA